MGHHARGHGHDFVEHRVHGHGFAAVQAGQQGVLFQQRGLYLGAQKFGHGKVGGADADARHLVLVAGADAPARGADLGFVGLVALAGHVQRLVVGHDHVGLAADHQPRRRNVHVLAAQGFHLAAEHGGVEHDAVADETFLARMQDARRDEVQDVLLVAHQHGVPGVVAALETHDHVALAGQQIDDLALALIAPLGAHHDHV